MKNPPQVVKATLATKRAAVFGALVAFLLAGCAVMPQPKTPAQAFYAAYGAYATVAQTTADLLNNGTITKPQAVNVQGYLAKIRPKLDDARHLIESGQGIPNTRVEWLQTVQRALLAIQHELTEVGNG